MPPSRSRPRPRPTPPAGPGAPGPGRGWGRGRGPPGRVPPRVCDKLGLSGSVSAWSRQLSGGRLVLWLCSRAAASLCDALVAFSRRGAGPGLLLTLVTAMAARQPVPRVRYEAGRAPWSSLHISGRSWREAWGFGAGRKRARASWPWPELPRPQPRPLPPPRPLPSSSASRTSPASADTGQKQRRTVFCGAGGSLLGAGPRRTFCLAFSRCGLWGLLYHGEEARNHRVPFGASSSCRFRAYYLCFLTQESCSNWSPNPRLSGGKLHSHLPTRSCWYSP